MSNVDLKPRKETVYRGPVEKPYQTWWLADESEIANHVWSLVTTLQENQSDRRTQDLRHAYLYQNRASSILAMGANIRGVPEGFNVTYNVAQSATDTLTAKIAQNKPRPRILTIKGDYAKQSRANLLGQYVDGVLDSAKTYRQGPQIFKDGCIFGTGVMKVYGDTQRGRVVTERVLPTEILVDELEAAYGEPQNLFQVRLVSRDALMRQFPEYKAQILMAAAEPMKGNRKSSVDMLKVVEAWHLPDADGNDGRHVICICDQILANDEWAHKVFPFAFFRYQTSIASFYGRGVVEELVGTQLEINKLLRDIQMAQHLIAQPRILIEQNSKISMAHINNQIASAIKYTGVKPDFINPIAMSNEIYSHVKWLISSAFEKVGISQLSASGKKPSGLDSRVALREQQDIESERFATTEANYRDFFDDVVQRIIIFSRELYQDLPKLQVTVETRKFIAQIKWSDVDMDDDRFVSRVYSSSLFPTTPAAKLQKIEEYIQAGWMNREDGLRMMDHPDVESWESLETADRDYLERIIGDILSKGVYRAPEPEMMITEDINVARKHYLEALNTEVEPERIEMLYRWIEAASSLLPALPAPPAAPMLPSTPSAVPMPLPQSGLMPQV